MSSLLSLLSPYVLLPSCVQYNCKSPLATIYLSLRTEILASSSLVISISSLFFSLSTSLLLTISRMAIDTCLSLQLVQFLLHFLLLVYFPFAFFSRMCCIIKIATIFVIIQHDGGTLDFRKSYCLINPTWCYRCRWMFNVHNQRPREYIFICPKINDKVFFGKCCGSILNTLLTYTQHKGKF